MHYPGIRTLIPKASLCPKELELNGWSREATTKIIPLASGRSAEGALPIRSDAEVCGVTLRDN
jgi:hypothetical protein